MPFIGKQPDRGTIRILDTITPANGTTFPLQVEGENFFAASSASLIVSVNGVIQSPNTYSVNGQFIIFDSALTDSDVINHIVSFGDPIDIGVTSDASVTTAKLANGSVTTLKLADSSVTTSKLVDSSVTTSKLADGSVTAAKLDPGIDFGGSAITDGTKTLDFSDSSDLQADTNFYPTANGVYDLGSSTNRWQNVYTSDLHLNNGIGDYTVVEGEEDLFLYNNKSSKVFKFALVEVDPSEATPKIKDLGES